MAYTIISRGADLIGINPAFGVSFDIEGLTYVSSYDELPDLNKFYWDALTNCFLPLEATRVLTKLQFRRRFTQEERVMVDAFNTSFESHPVLSVEQKAILRTGLEDYNVASEVNLDDPSTSQMLTLYAALGIINPSRIVEILI